MLRALTLAFAQLSDPRVRRVVWIGVFASALAYALLAGGTAWALSATPLTGYAWVDGIIDLLGGVGVLLVAWLLFPATVGTVSSFFLDEVVERVEARHYPGLPAPRHSGWLIELATALRFLLLVIAVNLLALPLYFAAPGLNLIVFYTINGYLLGREYFEMVAHRRLDRAQVRALRRARPLKPFLAGVAIAFLSSIPFVNLLVPVVASAFMVHVLQSMSAPLAAGRTTVIRR
ncbi:EI24 domain-containing protein [Azospirillum sp. TSO35-2]|uniref:EI24 domain-containing protein n=1 Tax=Azospirillum sp. TSO35-2 TaxID=716796 RepID=UPI000D61902D|nr:EI24 domain-containing protein [Azospirillum sp. TSO35-2]PWC39318.1 hypothetical protein TSO352_03785 [Azospirillum sp. TSO35-2]